MIEFTEPPINVRPCCGWCNLRLEWKETTCVSCQSMEHLTSFCDQECLEKAWPKHEQVHLIQRRIFSYFSTKTRNLPVRVRYINETFGKGLFTSKCIKKDEILFEETPFIGRLDWEKNQPNTCSHCAAKMSKTNSFCDNCCGRMYCSDQCKKESWEKYHQLECRESFKEFVALCSTNRWNSGMFAARAFMHIILAYRNGTLGEVLEGYAQFCTARQEDIAKNRPDWDTHKQDLLRLWKDSYELLMIHLEKCEIPPFLKELFTFDEYQKFIGKRTLNNFNGGLFVLQSTMNHSCHPNVVVEEIPSLLRIRVRALRNIQEGEQLFQTYVAPFWGRDQRRSHLKRNYMFACECVRCTLEYNLSSDLLSDLIKFSIRAV